MNDRPRDFYSYTKLGQVILLLCTGIFLYGCGGRVSVPVYEPTEQNYPEPAEPEVEVVPPASSIDMMSGPAAPLYRKAKSLLIQKEYKQAELTMERALRIEPKNGYYWYMLAEIASSQKQNGRTVQFCLKSKSLAGSDTRLINLNEQLIEKSR